MSLNSGTRLGPYEVTGSLGVGGMGEVYRARDTRLKRDVALKILPESFATDADRRARFQREAEVLASLSHPNIAAIYGLEESETTRALVMELVEGETLADRIARGPIPLDEALPIAKQIAEALEAAHEHGIIHRDLKPANIKVRPDGTVKVLDFGLAKLAEASGAGRAGEAGREAVSMSPTITSPAMMTGIGVLLGTAAYMSPEQARGKVADKRSDIWAFGCVLYEMLTGRRVFGADEVSDTLAMVLLKEIDWTLLPATTPSAIRTLLRRCLEKNRRHRLPDIGSARLEIDETLAAPAASMPASVEAPRSRRHSRWTAAVLAGVAVVASAAALILAWLHFTERRPDAPSSIRFSVTAPAGTSFGASGGPMPSPDGRRIAFLVATGANAAGVRLAVRSLGEEEPRVLPGTEGVVSAFWSPDSRSLGFFAAGKLRKIDVAGGPPQVVCDLPGAGTGSGGAWNSDGTILFGSGEPGAGLLRVPSGGGTPVPVTKPDASRNEQVHRHPRFLPDGRHFLYVVTPRPGGGLSPTHRVYIGSLDGDPPMPLMQADAGAEYAESHVLFVRDGTLLAQQFDAARRITTGDPIVVAPDIGVNPGAATAAFSVSGGMLAYLTASSTAVASQLVWLDRSGKALATIGEKTDQSELQLSPDGTRVSVSVLDPSRQTRDIWIHDLTRDGLRTRFTFDAGEDWRSVWSPDGRSLAYSAGRPSPLNLYRKPSDGSGAEEQLLESAGNKYISSWSADGRFLLYGTGAGGSATSTDIWVLPLTGERKPSPFVQTPFSEGIGRFSPDGRWVAYNSNESGRLEVYVVPFPMAGGKWQISAGGGEQPRWRRDGKELFYLNGNVIMAAEVNGTGAAFQVGAARRLFEVRRRTESYRGFGLGSAYDVTPDGQRFLVNVVDQAGLPPPVTVITNWAATLR